jgi:isocitrate dehydrogenase (NAD+)
MTHKVTLIPGDGIGPEVTQATVRILEATGVKFEWETFAAGAEAFEKYKEYIPKELTESIERTRVGLKGPVTTPIGGGFSSINVELRKRFELFATSGPSGTCLTFQRGTPMLTSSSCAKTPKASTPESSTK